MRILLICSKKFYSSIPPIEKALASAGHTVELPNCYEDEGAEERAWSISDAEPDLPPGKPGGFRIGFH